MPELEATAPPIPFWFYRVVAGAGALTIFVRHPRARGGAERRAESGPSFGPRAGRFLFDLIDGSERWGGAVAEALARMPFTSGVNNFPQ